MLASTPGCLGLRADSQQLAGVIGSSIVFRACVGHLTKCLTIVTSPTAIKGTTYCSTIGQGPWLTPVWMDGRSPIGVEGLCFSHPVIRVVCSSHSLPHYTPHLLPVSCLYIGVSAVRRQWQLQRTAGCPTIGELVRSPHSGAVMQQHFMTASVHRRFRCQVNSLIAATATS